MRPLAIYPVRGLPEIDQRVSLAGLILKGIRQLRLLLQPADVVVVTQKIVSKAEGRVIDLNRVVASRPARELAERIRFDPRHVQVILDESVRVVREAPHVLITETRHGFICANAGVDRSNSGGPDRLVLLPNDPDASAAHLRDELERLSGVAIGVIISEIVCPLALRVLNLNLTMPKVGRLCDTRASTTSTSSVRSSPGRNGASHRI